MKWFSVAPLHGLELNPDVNFEFSDGIFLRPLPDWVKNQSLVETLSSFDREAFSITTHGLVVSYDSGILGSPETMGIQNANYNLMVLANLALWLARPSPVCFKLIGHAPLVGREHTFQHIEKYQPIYIHPKDEMVQITECDINLAKDIHFPMVELIMNGKNAMTTAVEATWAALNMYKEEIRYILFWVVLEALFGPEDGKEVTYRLCQRLAFFLAKDKVAARNLFDKAKKGYGLRSKVVHGRWKWNPDSDKFMADAETFTRESLIRLLQDHKLASVFSGKNRERYLDGLVFKDCQ